ncbi:hypothetical protein SAMN05421640_2535 [Ekhidna lutea]|uniref:Calx-beta domain-containing protein n=2 Tax=Ekhidna lutea TaxID=447679 RepID=A0A239KAW8_EKHLU|nr:hypothetical protein SAMN05421640_2535 [Ekhidna lutea]
MLNKLYTLLFAAILMVGVSCSETETQAIITEQFIAFDTESAVILENSPDSAVIQVLMAAALQSSDITVDYNLEITAGDADDFTLSNTSGSLTIPAGQASASLEIHPIDNVFSDGDKVLVFTITNVSGGDFTIGLPGPDGNNASVTVTIGDDDCPIDLDAYVGEWVYIDAIGKPGSCCEGSSLNGFGFTNSGGNATLTADPSDPSGTTAIFSGGPFGSDYTIKFLTCPQEVIALGTTDSFVGVGSWNMPQGQTNGVYTETTISVVGGLGGNGDFEMMFEKAD